MNDLPLISVIIPVYGVEKYLDQCIQSIVNQTYSNIEIILVEDGSPDNSGAICDAWAAKDCRIVVIHQKNAGAGAARNAALDAARGTLLSFVDSDDYICPDMFMHLYEMLQQGADIAECDYLETVGDDAIFPDTNEETKFYTMRDAMAEHIRDTVFRQLIWNKLYRREMVGQSRFPVGKKIDDEFFTYQVLGRAKRLARSNRICYAYRQQQGSVMHETFSIRRLDGLDAKQERLNYIQEYCPELTDLAKADLIESCLFCMQSSLRSLRGTELEQAQSKIFDAMACTKAIKLDNGFSIKKKLLLSLAQWNLELTGKLLNRLIDWHLLT